jgi:hypothetical protein
VPAWATHLGRGLTDTVLDNETDPLNLEGGEIAKAARGAIGLAAKGIGAAEKLPLVGDKIAAAAQGATDAGTAIHDYFTHAGKPTREVGKEAVDHVVGTAAKAASHETELDARLQKRFDTIRAGMTDDEFTTALRIQKGERQALTNEGRPLVSDATLAGAAALKHLLKQGYALRADASGQRRIAQLVGDRPATSKTVVAQVRPKVNEVEATRDIEQNNIARSRVVAAFEKDALPTIEQHPDYIAAVQALRDYRVGDKGMSEANIAANAERLKATTAHRVAGDRFARFLPKTRSSRRLTWAVPGACSRRAARATSPTPARRSASPARSQTRSTRPSRPSTTRSGRSSIARRGRSPSPAARRRRRTRSIRTSRSFPANPAEAVQTPLRSGTARSESRGAGPPSADVQPTR